MELENVGASDKVTKNWSMLQKVGAENKFLLIITVVLEKHLI